MAENVSTFFSTCAHCFASYSGKRVPRPMGNSLHSDTLNELIHFDYLYIGKGDTGHIYILIVKDDASSYVWLDPTENADAETAADVLLRWFAAFGVLQMWNSDQGNHFKNALMNTINRPFFPQDHFTNVTVEIVCKEVIKTYRALLL